MSRTTSRAALVAALTCLLAPAAADAATPRTTTFSVKLEAHRGVLWELPRTESGGDCNGKDYREGDGKEDFDITSGTAGRLVIETMRGRLVSWNFGTENSRGGFRGMAPAAIGDLDRRRRFVVGNTGGWCGGASSEPAPPADCGRKRISMTYRLVRTDKGVKLSEQRVGDRPYFSGFCKLYTPEGVPEHSLPELLAPLSVEELLGERKVELTAHRAWTMSPVPFGISPEHQAMAEYNWTAKLTRIRNLEIRNENGYAVGVRRGRGGLVKAL